MLLQRIKRNPIKTVVFTSTILSSSFYLSDDKRRHQTTRLFHAGARISNLVLTAGIMVADYTYHLYWRYTKELEHIANKQDELKSLQKDQEYYLLQYIHYSKNMKPNTPKEQQEIERMKWWKKVQETRKIMDNLTEEINSLYKTNRDLFYSDLHKRNAIRLRDMCAKNGGIYVKLGQHLAMLDHVVPREYREYLVSLLADTPPSSYESIERIFQEDFNNLKPLQIFDSFEIKPIASASLAQVHIAYKDGKKYAVKVQHEGLLDGAHADLLMITKIVDVLSANFRDFNYRWLTREMNLNLPLELNFLNELKNIDMVKKDLKETIKTGDVVVPETIREYSSERVLTMSFEEGFHLNNKKELQNLQLQGIDVSTLVSKIFSEQIFKHGFVHCDPHEANLLFRPHPTKKNKPQIVLLDHGLYRKLDDSFRRNYCRLWQAIILADETGIEKYGKKLNAGPLYALLAAVLTLKPWDSIISGEGPEDSVNNSAKKASDLILLQSYARLYYREIVDLLATVPSDLLLLFKTNDCLRHLDKILDTPVNSTAVVAKVASSVIFQEEMTGLIRHWHGLNSVNRFFHSLFRWCNVMGRIILFSNAVYYGTAIKSYYDSWYEYFFGPTPPSTEDGSTSASFQPKIVALAYSTQ